MSKKDLTPKNNFLRQHWLLVGLGCGLMVWWLIQSLYAWQPPGFTSAEAALGNDALANQWWKSSSPIYSLILSGIFTLLPETVETLRLPALISGLFLPFAIGLLSYEMFRNWRSAVFAGLLSLIAPWTIQLSQAAFSQMLSMCIGVLGLVWLLRNKVAMGSGFILLGSLSHPASAVFLPLVTGFIIWRKKMLFSRVILGWLAMVLLVGIVYQEQLFNFYLVGAFYKEVGFVNRINELRGYVQGSPFALLAPILFNKVSWGIKIVVDNWLAPWDWYWWFHHSRYPQSLLVDQLGKFYFIDMLFFVIGINSIYKVGLGKTSTNEVKKNGWWLLVAWLATSSLPGLLHEQANWNETFFWIIPAWFVIVGYGLDRILQYVNKWKITLVLVLFVHLAGMQTFSAFYTQVFPQIAAKQWEYGYQQVVEEVEKLPTSQALIVTDRLGGNPKQQFKYLYPQLLATRQVSFNSLNPQTIIPGDSMLYVATPEEVPEEIVECEHEAKCTNNVTTIRYPDDSVAAYIFIWK